MKLCYLIDSLNLILEIMVFHYYNGLQWILITIVPYAVESALSLHAKTESTGGLIVQIIRHGT